MDCSYLIKLVPSFIKKDIADWACVGFSLGGHTTCLALANEPKITSGVSIVGCGDYETLMINRALSLGYQVPPTCYDHLPRQLLTLLRSTDPVNLPENQPITYQARRINLFLKLIKIALFTRWRTLFR